MGKTKVQFWDPEKEENIIVLWLDRTYTVAKAERNRAEEKDRTEVRWYYRDRGQGYVRAEQEKLKAEQENNEA